MFVHNPCFHCYNIRFFPACFLFLLFVLFLVGLFHFYGIVVLNGLERGGLARLLHLAGKKQFVQYVVRPFKIENQIQFRHLVGHSGIKRRIYESVRSRVVMFSRDDSIYQQSCHLRFRNTGPGLRRSGE